MIKIGQGERGRAKNCFKIWISKIRINFQVFCKKDVLRNFAKFTGKHLCQSLFFNKGLACNFIKKETLAQVFSFEFCEISKNTFSTEHLRTTASLRNTMFIFTKSIQIRLITLFENKHCFCCFHYRIVAIFNVNFRYCLDTDIES